MREKPSTEADTYAMNTEESNSQEPVERYLYSRRETAFTMIGVMLVLFLSMLDQTIVATATPHIIADLQGFDRIAWVSTAYLLTSTVMIPIYGKLSDLFGRKLLFLCGIMIFLAGSALSGAAQSIDQLILFRGFQGLGAGALQPIAVAIVGDLFTPRERGRWQGLTGSMYALAAIVGPLVGGWLTDHASWRWVFYVNIPVGIVDRKSTRLNSSHTVIYTLSLQRRSSDLHVRAGSHRWSACRRLAHRSCLVALGVLCQYSCWHRRLPGLALSHASLA